MLFMNSSYFYTVNARITRQTFNILYSQEGQPKVSIELETVDRKAARYHTYISWTPEIKTFCKVV